MNPIKTILLSISALAVSTANAQTDVTTKHMENADFQARFAAWNNPGSFTYSVADNFEQRNGEVWMEKWVTTGNKLGSNAGIYQILSDLPVGSYTLTVAAKHINQANTSKKCSGAYLYGGSAKTEFTEAGDYSIDFTILTGRTKVGVELVNADGNWCCVDNFRLTYNGINATAITEEFELLISKAQSLLAEGGNKSTELWTAISSAQAAQTSTDAATIHEAALGLERAMLSYQIANATGTAPEVTTHPFVAKGTTMAFARATFKGTGIQERGICYSTEPEPTVLNDRCTYALSPANSKGWVGSIYTLQNLKPGTIYYVRAYAITKTNAVGYGEVVKIATLPKGNMTWSYDNACDDVAVNRRISSATQECVWMYNNLSHITGFHLSVHYVWGAGAGGGTADCSYGGWMRVSQTTSYQQTGTMLHETNHGVGVGTTGEWYNNANLRAQTSKGTWLGPQATRMVSFLNNANGVMTGDDVHMWPYGINGAHEDDYQPSNQSLYFSNILITHAMHQDGLISTSGRGFATPAYLFTQDDNEKYYITVESSDNGNGTSYLTLTDAGTPRSFVKSASELKQDDKFAWQITYDAATSYYILKNIGTGRYLTYDGTSFSSSPTSNPSSSEMFHFMPARTDIKLSTHTITPYWMLSSNGHRALTAGAASTDGSYYTTTTKAFDASNNASAQRWLFITSDLLDEQEQSVIKEQKETLRALMENVKATFATPHTVKLASADIATIDASLSDLLNDIEEDMDHYTTPQEVKTAISNLETGLLNFLKQVKPASVLAPFDLQYLLQNTGFDNGNLAWSNPGTVNNSCMEFYQVNSDLSQTTKLKMPIGTYRLQVQAFQRPGSYEGTYADWSAGTDNSKAFIYLNKITSAFKQNVKNICAESSPTSITGSVAAASGFYIPNTQAGAANFFKKGYYENEKLATTTANDYIKVGLRTVLSSEKSWTVCDNFRLQYYGNYTIEEIENPATGITTVTSKEKEDKAVYDLSGRRLTQPARHGIYIRNGKKVIQ